MFRVWWGIGEHLAKLQAKWLIVSCAPFALDFLLQISLLSLTAKEFWKSVNIWWSYGQEFGVLFLTHSVDTILFLLLLLCKITVLKITAPNVNRTFFRWCDQKCFIRALTCGNSCTTAEMFQLTVRNWFLISNERLRSPHISANWYMQVLGLISWPTFTLLSPALLAGVADE